MEPKIIDQRLTELNRFEACLSPDFDRLPPEQIYKEYEMEVPEEVMDFCRIIESEGGRALLVGGCARDMIISKENGEEKLIPKDIDIEVYGITPKHLSALIVMKFGEKTDKTHGNKFELISVNSRDKKMKFDISIAREDNKTGTGSKGFETHSHPEYTIKEGAQRRDITCNSMAYDPLIKITYDPYGGKKDILDGVIRATDPEKFVEDPVRILRIMRFAARYDWKIDGETEELCREMLVSGSDHELIKRLRNDKNKKVVVGGNEKKTEAALKIMNKSAIELDDEVKERLYAEFAKMFVEGGKPSVGLEFIRRVGVIDRYFPWLAELVVTEQEYKWHPEGNAWKHTLQVADVAAEIAKREKLNEEETLELVVSTLSHDLGKPTKTKREWRDVEASISASDMEPNWLPDNVIEKFSYIDDLKIDWGVDRDVVDSETKERVQVITSNGHDMEGGWLSEEFINAFAPMAKVKVERDKNGDYKGLEETDFQKEMRKKVRLLTEKHMQLKAWYLEYKKYKAKNPEKAEKQARRWLGGLARELAENGTSIHMLSFLTEADQRGRNGESDTPLERSEVEDLENWQSWLNEMMKEVKIEKKLPDKIVKGEEMKEVTGLKEGVELGVVSSWVFDDQLAGEFVTVEEGLERAKVYAETVKQCLTYAKEENWKTVSKYGKKKPPRVEDEVCSWLKEDGVRERVIADVRISILEKVVEKNTDRVATLGEWPEYIKRETLLERIPKNDGKKAAGFDAGVACALGLIPEDKQKLAASLHANYTPESVEQVRLEIENNDPESPTTWWLAACAVCKEGKINVEEFLNQVDEFKQLASNPEERLLRAKKEFEKMTGSFEIVNGVPFGTEDGCMQGAYLAGYKYAVMYAKEYDVYFVGTYLPSLGLDGFKWSTTETGEFDNKSGPVFGSKQFVKCKDEKELEEVLKRVNIV